MPGTLGYIPWPRPPPHRGSGGAQYRFGHSIRGTLGHDGHTVGANQLPGGGLVRAGQVEKIVGRGGARLVLADHVIVFGAAGNLAAMRDGLNVVLVLVARLVQGVLGESWLTVLCYTGAFRLGSSVKRAILKRRFGSGNLFFFFL